MHLSGSLGNRVEAEAPPMGSEGSRRRRGLKCGGPTNVAVPDAEQLVVIVLTPMAGEHDEADCPVSRKSDVGMLLLLLRASGAPARCRLSEPNYEAELVNPDQAVVA